MNAAPCLAELIELAKTAFAEGYNHFREATEYLAALQERGMTQREIAKAVEQSLGWVNRLLKWRKSGYKEATPFGAQSRAARERRKDVQPTEQDESDTPKHSAESEPNNSERLRAELNKAKADAEHAKAEAAKAKADALRAKTEAAKAKAESFRRSFGFRDARAKQARIGAKERALLVKCLGMLGSNQFGERQNAVMHVEKIRKQLGLTWDELIVPASRIEVDNAA